MSIEHTPHTHRHNWPIWTLTLSTWFLWNHHNIAYPMHFKLSAKQANYAKRHVSPDRWDVRMRDGRECGHWKKQRITTWLNDTSCKRPSHLLVGGQTNITSHLIWSHRMHAIIPAHTFCCFKSFCWLFFYLFRPANVYCALDLVLLIKVTHLNCFCFGVCACTTHKIARAK